MHKFDLSREVPKWSQLGQATARDPNPINHSRLGGGDSAVGPGTPMVTQKRRPEQNFADPPEIASPATRRSVGCKKAKSERSNETDEDDARLATLKELKIRNAFLKEKNETENYKA